jgi:recombination protein RecA
VPPLQSDAMSIQQILAKTVKELRELKEFSFGVGEPTTANLFGVGDVPAWIPSGVSMLDRALGGGLPLGRISELFSENEGEGKTSIALQFAAQTQKAGGVVVWLEAENALDKPRAARLGLDLETAVIFSPPTVEDGFCFIDHIVKQISADADLRGCPILIVWDTIAASPTAAEKAGTPFSGGMTEKPRIISSNLRRYVVEFFKYKLHLCLINQSITNIGKNMYGPQFVTPGGKAIKFYSSLRLKCHRSGYIGIARKLESTDQKLGISVQVQAVKNKLALPFRPVDLHLYGETGYDDVMSMAELFMSAKIKECVDQKGAWITLPGDVKCQWANIRETALAHPHILEVWRAKVEEMFPIPPNRIKDPKTGWYIRAPDAKPAAATLKVEDTVVEAPK